VLLDLRTVFSDQLEALRNALKTVDSTTLGSV
jgi:hypothetical protein